MNTPFLLTWLGSTLLPLGALWLVYRLALRRERCFSYNRALLLLAPVVAVGLPLLPHPALPAWLAGGQAPSVAVLLPTLSATVPTVRASLPDWSWAVGLYAVGAGLLLGRLAYQLGQLHRATRRLPCEARPGYVLAYTGGRLPTSSFGRTVLWDETADLTPAEATSVLAHELAHVRQGHTYDVLWLELWRIVLWPNPFAHLLLPALRLTHELLADQVAAQATTSAALADAVVAYPALLARLAVRGVAANSYAALIQPLTFSFTLTRIAMLHNQHPVRRWKQWLVLPMLGGVFMTACQSTSNQPVPDIAKQSPVVGTEEMAPPPPPTLTTLPQAVLDEARRGHVYRFVEQMPQLPTERGMEPIVKQIQKNLGHPIGTRQEGMVFASFVVNADGSVGDTKIVKGLAPAYNEAVVAAIRQLPRFVPGKQGGQAVAVSFTVPVMFKNQP
ncbi:TonB family protein [Hymenobacter sp. BRD67]|uniref:TonB family protein n=1 Tax=Hymenobacter sp. BRD67 TaxID=2675877 RepID=UPI0015644607|nr:M56 family metallopeptidase [Hymenobacter sp. BRD67]QKG51303.1 TonB family protein [Hymenobacter sp. BRD67]